MTDSQKAHLLAGLAGCALPTAEKYLRGEPIKGAHLRVRLADASKRLDSIARDSAPPEKSAGRRTPSNA